MVDLEKERNRIQVALDSLQGIQEALQVLHEDSGFSKNDSKRSDAMISLIYLLGEKINEAQHSAYAMEFGQFCTDDPRHRPELNS